MSTSPEQYRQAWRKFPTGVSVITMRSGSGEPYVTTANALLSISLDPMLLLLSVATDGNTCANLLRDGLFAVNFLRSDQSHIADFYARAPSHERSNLPDAHTKHESGIALFDDALVCMVCRCQHDLVGACRGRRRCRRCAGRRRSTAHPSRARRRFRSGCAPCRP